MDDKIGQPTCSSMKIHLVIWYDPSPLADFKGVALFINSAAPPIWSSL